MECFNHARDVDKSFWVFDEAETYTVADPATGSLREEQSLRRDEAVRRKMERSSHAFEVDKRLRTINKTEERHASTDSAGTDSTGASKDRKKEPANVHESYRALKQTSHVRLPHFVPPSVQDAAQKSLMPGRKWGWCDDFDKKAVHEDLCQPLVQSHSDRVRIEGSQGQS